MSALVSVRIRPLYPLCLVVTPLILWGSNEGHEARAVRLVADFCGTTRPPALQPAALYRHQAARER
jgi:hypothetical protein